MDQKKIWLVLVLSALVVELHLYIDFPNIKNSLRSLIRHVLISDLSKFFIFGKSTSATTPAHSTLVFSVNYSSSSSPSSSPPESAVAAKKRNRKTMPSLVCYFTKCAMNDTVPSIQLKVSLPKKTIKQ